MGKTVESRNRLHLSGAQLARALNAVCDATRTLELVGNDIAAATTIATRQHWETRQGMAAFRLGMARQTLESQGIDVDAALAAGGIIADEASVAGLLAWRDDWVTWPERADGLAELVAAGALAPRFRLGWSRLKQLAPGWARAAGMTLPPTRPGRPPGT